MLQSEHACPSRMASVLWRISAMGVP